MGDTSGIVLWDVDTQRDFCDPDGRLFVPGADAPAVRAAQAALVRLAAESGLVRVASADDHQLADAEISDDPDWCRTFPPHCLRGTRGAERIPETILADPLPLGELGYPPGRVAELARGRREILLMKDNVDVFTNPSAATVLEVLGVRRAILFGVATDICVNITVRGLRGAGVEVTVVDEASAALDADRAEACRAGWREGGVTFATVKEVAAELAPGQ